MRRLPIYFFVDIFPSLPIQETKKIENFIIDFIQSCRQNPHALETVYLSINNLCENNISLNKLFKFDIFIFRIINKIYIIIHI